MFKSDSSSVGDRNTDARASSTPDALSRVLARLEHEQYDEAQCSAPDGVELVGEARAFDEGYRKGHNAAKRDVIELIERMRCEAADQQPVLTGLRELRDAAPKVVLQRHWLAEHEHAGEGG